MGSAQSNLTQELESDIPEYPEYPEYDI